MIQNILYLGTNLNFVSLILPGRREYKLIIFFLDSLDLD